MNIKASPATPLVTVQAQPPAKPAAAPAQPQPTAAAAQPQPTDAAPEKESKMGLLDYPKEGLLAMTKMAAKGQAKNIVEFAEDLKDINTAGKDFVKSVKEGDVLGVVRNVGKMGFNAISAHINAMQAGAAGFAGSVSAVISTPFVALDYGAEAVGKALSEKENGVVSGIGKGFQFLGGVNSDKGVFDAVSEGKKEGIKSALNNQ